MEKRKGLGSYIKSRRHYINSVKFILRDKNLEIGESMTQKLEELYEVSKDIEFSCAGDNIKVPALWLSYRLKECEDQDSMRSVAMEVSPLIKASYEYIESENVDAFSEFEDFTWEEWTDE